MRFLFFAVALIFPFVSDSLSQYSREINKTIPLKPDGQLIIDTYKGAIDITCHDKPQVEITVKIEADDIDSFDAEQDVKDTEIDIQSSDSELRIKTNYRKAERNNDYNFWDWITDPRRMSYSLPLTHYTIRMPRTASLRIKDYKSKAYIEGLKSYLTFNTYKGALDMQNFIGGVDIETYKGNILITFTTLASNSHFETYKGKITVNLPKKAGFELQTDFEKRVNFSSDFDVEKIERNRKKRHYDYAGNINGGGHALEFKSDKGSIRLRAK